MYGDGALLQITEVQSSDADVYRCTGYDGFGRSTYDDFVLEVIPGMTAGYIFPYVKKVANK